MGLEQTLKDPSNGLLDKAYLKKHALKFEVNNTGRIEMEAWQDQKTRDGDNAERMQELLTIVIGENEICREEITGTEEKPVIVKHELMQIAYNDIKTEYDALWAKIYSIIKKNKILYSGVETDLIKSKDII